MKREERLREELEEAWFALVVEKIAQQEGAELNAQTATDGISIPMHAGAVKYFTEIGTIAE